MTRHKKLKCFARIKLEPDGRLAISPRYPGLHLGQSTSYIGPGKELFDVPFAKWKRYAGKVVDLTKWRGSGPGMIGGPKTYEISWIMSEKLEQCLFDDVGDAERTLARFRAELKEPRIEFKGEARRQKAGFIRKTRAYLRFLGVRVIGGKAVIERPEQRRLGREDGPDFERLLGWLLNRPLTL